MAALFEALVQTRTLQSRFRNRGLEHLETVFIHHLARNAQVGRLTCDRFTNFTILSLLLKTVLAHFKD